MSLDFYLEDGVTQKDCYHCGQSYEEANEVFWRNITHNLTQMADEVGILGYTPCRTDQLLAVKRLQEIKRERE